MGVKWVLSWRPMRGVVPSATDDAIIMRILEGLQVKLDRADKKFEIKCMLLRQNTTPPPGVSALQNVVALKDLWVVQSNDETPETCYLVNKQDRLILEADTGMFKVLDSKLDYKMRNVVQLEGRRFTKSDWTIRLLTAGQRSGSAGFVGHALEVEYLAVNHLEVAAAIMEEFVEMMRAYIPRNEQGQPLGSLEVLRPMFSRYPSLPSSFSHMHAALQYCEVVLDLLRHSEGMKHLQQQQQQQQQQMQMQQQRQ